MALNINTEGLQTPAIPEGNVKLGTGKFSAPTSSTNQSVDIVTQANAMKSNFEGKTLNDIYSSMIASRPTNTEIQQAIGRNTGLLDKMDGARAQIMDIQRKMLGDQSQIFNATNPDGTPVDPRIKVAQYNANMKSYADRIDQLGQLQNAYSAELATLSKFEQERLDAENEKNKVALQYLKDINDQEYRERTFKENQRQFNISEQRRGYEFDVTREDKAREFNANLYKPELKQDASTGEFVYVSPGKDYTTTIGNGRGPSFMGNRIAGDKGVDFEGTQGFAVSSPISGVVDKVNTGYDKYFGHWIKIKDPKTNEIVQLSHLDGETIKNLKPGDTIGAGQIIGNQKNTGTVIFKDKANKANKGILDITMFGANGKKLEPEETLRRLKSVSTANIQRTGVQGATTKKDSDLGSYLKSVKIPDKYTPQEQIPKIIEDLNAEFPTAKYEDIYNALYNVAPKKLKDAMNIYSETQELIVPGKDKKTELDKLTKESTITLVKDLAGQYTTDGALKILLNAGFFDKYTSSWTGDDDQYDAVQEWYANKSKISLDDKIEQMKKSLDEQRKDMAKGEKDFNL